MNLTNNIHQITVIESIHKIKILYGWSNIISVHNVHIQTPIIALMNAVYL